MSRITRYLVLLCILALIVSLAATACQREQGTPPPSADWARHELPELRPLGLAPGQKLRAVATTNIVGDVVRNVAGDAIALTVLLRVGQDPHSYQPVPSDLTAVSDAQVVFASGFGLEEFLADMLENVGGERYLIYVSAGIEPHMGHGHADEEHADDEHQAVDPHVWFDVRHVMTWAENIAQALSALDPENATQYAANAAAYQAELAKLDQWIMDQIAQIPEANRRLVTNHEAFGYYAERYGLEQVGAIYPVSPSAEPSAQDIARLETSIRELGVKAVFAESTVNPRLAQRVAQDTGLQIVPLYSGSLGEPGTGAESYIEMMRYNTNAIVAALR